MFSTLEFVPGTGNVLSTIESFKLPYTLGFVLCLAAGAPLWLDAKWLHTVSGGSGETAITFVAGALFAVGLSFLAPGVVAWVGLALAVSYRFSLKATALVWLSLLFALDNDRYTGPASALVARDRNNTTWELLRLVSLTVLAVMLLKVVVLPSAETRLPSEWSLVVNTYLTPGSVYPWQLAATVNALITLAWYYVFLGVAESRLAQGRWSSAQVSRFFRWFYAVRAALSTYTIPALLLITLNASQMLSFQLNLVTKPLPFDRPSEVLKER